MYSSSTNIVLQNAVKEEWLALDEVNNFLNPIAATLTFDCTGLSRQVAEQTMTIFINRLSRIAFGNANRRFGKGIRILAVLEGGEDTGKQFHYHCIIETPKHFDAELFCSVIKETWQKRRFTSRYFNDVCILKCESDVATYKDYILKRHSKAIYTDAIDIMNSNIKI